MIFDLIVGAQGQASSTFDPSTLMAAAWYDPSDPTTMFQDSLGSISVTADGQSVGLILDKSDGLVLGSNVITNGTFDTDTAWVKGIGVTISGGKANFSAAITYPLRQTGISSFVGNKWYEVKFTVSGYVAGEIRPYLGSGATPGATVSANGDYTQRVWTSSGTEFGFEVISSFTGSIDNVSLKELAGNHAYQTNSASRPLYKTDGTLHWLQFAGVDNLLVTSTASYTNTSKMTAWLGGKITDNLGSDGLFQIVSNGVGGLWGYTINNLIHVKTQGTVAQSAINFSANLVDKFVLTSLGNLVGATGPDCLTVRKNGVVAASATVVAGGGTYGTGQISLGYADSAYLTGNIYSMIVLDRAATSQEVTDTEHWVANKTGVTIP